jgi:hypothetical protein
MRKPRFHRIGLFWEHSIVTEDNGFSLHPLLAHPVELHRKREPTLTNLWNQLTFLRRRDGFIIRANHQYETIYLSGIGPLNVTACHFGVLINSEKIDSTPHSMQCNGMVWRVESRKHTFPFYLSSVQCRFVQMPIWNTFKGDGVIWIYVHSLRWITSQTEEFFIKNHQICKSANLQKRSTWLILFDWISILSETQLFHRFLNHFNRIIPRHSQFHLASCLWFSAFISSTVVHFHPFHSL